MAFYQNAYLCLNCVQTAIACTFCTALCASCCVADAEAAQRRRERESEKTVVVIRDTKEGIQVSGTNGADLPLLAFSNEGIGMERV